MQQLNNLYAKRKRISNVGAFIKEFGIFKFGLKLVQFNRCNTEVSCCNNYFLIYFIVLK